MNRRLATIIVLLGALLLTSCMSASFSGNYVLRAGKILHGNLFVTSGSVTMEEDSRVTGTIMLTSGELHIGRNAQVGGDVVLTSGALYLADGAHIHGDVILSSSDIGLHQSPGSTIDGNITSDIAPFVIAVLTKGVLIYCVLPIIILIAIILVLGLWLGRQSKKRTQIVTAPAAPAADDTAQKLQSLKKMLDEGLISQTDYDAKKADILSKM
jgi:hypothetical protein